MPWLLSASMGEGRDKNVPRRDILECSAEEWTGIDRTSTSLGELECGTGPHARQTETRETCIIYQVPGYYVTHGDRPVHRTTLHTASVYCEIASCTMSLRSSLTPLTTLHRQATVLYKSYSHAYGRNGQVPMSPFR
jgi:hypothetical protein